MIKAIIFDFFGVIRTDAYNAWLSAHDLARTGVYDDIARMQDKGLITNDEFFVRLHEASGQLVSMQDFDAMRQLDQGVVRILKALHGHYPLAVLSNSTASHLHRLLADDNLEQYFTEIIASAVVGLVKPDPAIFRLALQRLNVQPEEAVFIDDNPSNVAAAARLGITSIHFQSALQLKRDLVQSGVVLTNARSYIGQVVTVTIDRPAGSNHPKHLFEYPINYGYIAGTISGDDEELDAYILGIDQPHETFTGRCIAVIHRTNEDDDKLVVCAEGEQYTDEQIRAVTQFQEQWFESVIVRTSV